MEEYLLDLVVTVLSEKHKTDDLQWSESLELGPFNVEADKIRPSLLILGVGSDLFNRPVD